MRFSLVHRMKWFARPRRVAALVVVPLAFVALVSGVVFTQKSLSEGSSPPAEPTATFELTDTATITPSPTASPTPTETPLPTATPLPPSKPVAPPPIPADWPGERWIDVNVTEQTITAVIGDKPLYTAYATTGAPDWETPIGEWQIVARVLDETMTSAALDIPEGPDSYKLEHVMFTQYFTWGGHAIHLNYWRPDWVFGRVPMSHGCVGLRYADAEFFWNFASYGTWVIVHK